MEKRPLKKAKRFGKIFDNVKLLILWDLTLYNIRHNCFRFWFLPTLRVIFQAKKYHSWWKQMISLYLNQNYRYK